MTLIRTLLSLSFLFVFLNSCSDDSTVIDSNQPDLPLSFTSLTLSQYHFDTDTISVPIGTEKSSDDAVIIVFSLIVSTNEQSSATITDAHCIVTIEGKTDALLSVPLQKKNATDFIGTISLHRKRGDAGEYRVSVVGTDTRGMMTNPIMSKISIVYGSKPPSFCGLNAADTVDLPTIEKVVLPLRICVSDPSGVQDIKRVVFNSFLPDGRPSNGNPFIMYDDGLSSHGDLQTGDGEFSLLIELLPNSQKGTYRFEFQAFDFSNLSSNVLIHRIVVQ